MQGLGDTGVGGASALDTGSLSAEQTQGLSVGQWDLRNRRDLDGLGLAGRVCHGLKHRLCLSGLKILTAEH